MQRAAIFFGVLGFASAGAAQGQTLYLSNGYGGSYATYNSTWYGYGYIPSNVGRPIGYAPVGATWYNPLSGYGYAPATGLPWSANYRGQTAYAGQRPYAGAAVSAPSAQGSTLVARAREAAARDALVPVPRENDRGEALAAAAKDKSKLEPAVARVGAAASKSYRATPRP